MYGENSLITKSLKITNPVEMAIDREVASSNPEFAAQYGMAGTPGREAAKKDLEREKIENRNAFDLRLRTLYPNAFFPTAKVSGQSPLGTAFISMQPEAKDPRLVI